MMTLWPISCDVIFQTTKLDKLNKMATNGQSYFSSVCVNVLIKSYRLININNIYTFIMACRYLLYFKQISHKVLQQQAQTHPLSPGEKMEWFRLWLHSALDTCLDPNDCHMWLYFCSVSPPC